MLPLLRSQDRLAQPAGSRADPCETAFDDGSCDRLNHFRDRLARAKCDQRPPNPFVLDGAWWQRSPFAEVFDRPHKRPVTLDARLRDADATVRTAEEIFRLATADDPSPTIPLRLVYALDDMRDVMPLERTLADAASASDDAAVDMCLEIASRMAALACAYGSLTEEVLARDILRPVSAWLLQAVDALKHMQEPWNDAAAIVAKLAGTDAWLPPMAVARAAGRACSTTLLGRACIGAEQAFTQGLCVDVSACDFSQPRRPGVHDNPARVSVLVFLAFVSGMIDTRSAVPLDAWVDLRRGPMPMLVREIKRAADTTDLWWRCKAKCAVNRAMARLAEALNTQQGARRDAVAYVLSLLVAALRRRSVTDDAPEPKAMTTTALKIASILGDPADPSRSAVIDGLDVGAAEAQPHDRPRPPSVGQRCCQIDLLTRLGDHHPLLFVEVISHLCAWDIGSVALASSTHYARIIVAVRDDDTAETRRLSGVALSTTLWLRWCRDARPCDIEAETVTPSFDSGSLPGLRSLLLLCRRMPMLEASPGSWTDAILETTLAAACAVECGAAIARCADWLDYIPKLDGDDSDANDEPHHVMATIRRSVVDRDDLARHAGLLGSPLPMRMACDMLHSRPSDGEAHIRFVDGTQAKWLGRMIDKVVEGIRGGLDRVGDDRSDLFLAGLPALVDVVCGLLSAVQHDVNAHGPLPHDRAKLKGIMRAAGFTLLAPGAHLAAPEARTRLALGLFETANRI